MSKDINYKESLSEIETIIQKIETGEPQVDELSAMVKRAAVLIKMCKEKLRHTEDDLNQAMEEME